MNSRVHPKYKTEYRVTNWAEYDRALVKRGDITLWISPGAIQAWTAGPSGRRGAPQKYTDLAIETALTLRLVLRLPLCQAEGFLRSLLDLMDVSLEAPDHTTLSRRSKGLPPTRTASVSSRKPRSAARDRTIQRVAKIDRQRWKKESGYHRQGTVENAFYRYKLMLGDKLHARGLAAQKVEAAIGCNILNRLLVLSRPRSVAIAR